MPSSRSVPAAVPSRALTLLLLSCLFGSLLALATGVPVRAATGAPVFSPSGVDGAGFQNVTAVDPRNNGLILVGGDVAGIHRSTDWGRTWRIVNEGMTGLRMRKVSGIVFSPTTPDKVYAAVGYQGAGGGVMASTDGGMTWQVRSSVPQFSGDNNNLFPNLPNPHPRSTGNVLAVDAANGLLYAATFEQGLMRSADDGRTWTTLGLAGEYLRGLALDPSNPDVLYVAAYGDKVFKTTAARTTGNFGALPGSPTSAEELAVLDGKVYAVAAGAGLFASSDGGTTWARLGANDVRDDGPVWMALEVYRHPTTGAHVILVSGDDATPAGNGLYKNVVRSSDGGVTWSSLTSTASGIHFNTGGPGGPTWWLSQSQSGVMLGKASYTAAHITTAGADRSRIFLAGRSGVWASSDGGANWYPMVAGLGVTINKTIIADPNVPGRVFVGNTDWVSLSSNDAMATVAQTRPPGGSTGYALALDTAVTPSVVYEGTGHRDSNTSGEIYSNPDPLTRSWTSEGLGAATGGKRPLGVAVRRVGGTPIILAAVEAGGIWRKAGGAWQQVSTAAMGAQATEAASFSWLPGSPTVYLYDHQTGVWRSNDDGQSWTKIWAKPSTADMTGFVVADPADVSRLYVSASDGVYRLDGANAGTVGAGITSVKVGSFVNPGPMALAPGGKLYVAQPVRTASAASLSLSTDRGATWTTVSDALYRGAALFPWNMAAGPEGNLYVALNGSGVIVGSGSATPPPPPPADTTAPTVAVTAPAMDQVFTGTSVAMNGNASDNNGVAGVRVAIQDRNTGLWRRADGTWGAWQQQTAALGSPGAASTGWTYTFNAPGAGLYNVEAEAADAAGNLSARSTVRFEVRLPDTTAPTVGATAPTMDQVFTATSVGMNGNAADDRGVASVRVAIQDRTSNLWLRADGTWGAWEQRTATLASPGATSTGWGYNFNSPGAGLYGVQSEAVDAAGNPSARTWTRFEVRIADTSAPTVGVTAPTMDQVFRSLTASFNGNASDDRGVASVRVAIQDRTSNLWLRADGTWGAWEQRTATLASPGATSTGWSFTFNAPRAGLYGVQVEAADAAGSTSARTWTRFEIRLTKSGKVSSRGK